MAKLSFVHANYDNFLHVPTVFDKKKKQFKPLRFTLFSDLHHVRLGVSQQKGWNSLVSTFGGLVPVVSIAESVLITIVAAPLRTGQRNLFFFQAWQNQGGGKLLKASDGSR